MNKSSFGMDIDIGGTFTDCYIKLTENTAYSKALTTPHDLSVGFLRAAEECAKLLDISLDELLKQIETIRYSTTMAMNKLIERKGPRLALIMTEGFEDTIFIGKGSQWQDGLVVRDKRKIPLVRKPEPLISRDMVLGVKERMDSNGAVLRPLNEEDFRTKMHAAVDAGVRGFVVSLLWSYANPSHELRIKEIINEEYPDFYLGRLPVVLSHQVLPKKGEYSRTMTSILNAYLHQSMAEELSGIYDRLREHGYGKPIKMVHNTGGMVDMFGTNAVQTYNGGPVAGLIGSAYLGELYGMRNVIVTDMGGTSFDMGLVVEGSTRFYDFSPVINRWMVGNTMLESNSIGAGGGSIAWKAVEKHFGKESGIKGYLWGILLAGTSVGGVYVAFPVAYSLFNKGAKLSIIFTYIGASALTRIPMTVFEASFLGIKFTAC